MGEDEEGYDGGSMKAMVTLGRELTMALMVLSICQV